MDKIFVLLSLAFSCSLLALPTEGEVKAGQASACLGSNTLSITASDKAIIEYQKFNIERGETVRFIQPSPTSCVLTRVVGNDPSKILGELQANGRVFLVNPQGIYFGPDSQVNVGSFLATSLSLRDEDFLADRFHFSLDEGVTGSIVNEGTIKADGFISLFASQVENRGTILARAEKVFIGAAEKVTLDLTGDGLIQFRVDGELEKALIENYGKIEAAHGDIQITLKVAKQVIQSTLNTDGIEVATGVEESNGMVRLVCGSSMKAEKVIVEGEVVEAQGLIDASNLSPLEVGGRVELLGEQVKLLGAEIDVSGDCGGGVALIGGEFQGKGEQRNAKLTLMDELSIVRADAYTNGNGGKVILWADEATFFGGNISARGGSAGGDGGFVEVSAKWLTYQGFADTRAPNGKTGELLLDPVDVVIGSSATTGSFSPCGPPINYQFSGTGTNQIFATLLNSQLGTCNVTISTVGTTGVGSGSITVSTPISWSAPTTLTLTAASYISVNAQISNTSTATAFTAVNITANGGSVASSDGAAVSIKAQVASVGGGININGTAAVSGGGGVLISPGGSIPTTNGAINVSGVIPLGSSTSSYGVHFNTTNPIVTTDGAANVTISGRSNSSGGTSSGFVFSGTSWDVGPGNLIIENCHGGSGNGNNGVVFWSPITVGGNITIGGTGDVGTVQSGSGSAVGGSGGIAILNNITSTNGNISINVVNTSMFNTGHGHGIQIRAGAQISTGTGSITLKGVAGQGQYAATLIPAYGVYIENGSRVFSTSGAITITGTVGVNGGMGAGIYLNSTISPITSTSGLISLLGTSASPAAGSYGIHVNNSVTWAAGSTSALNLTGIHTGSLSGSHGIYINTALSNTGAITFAGTPGSGPNSFGTFVGANITTSGSGISFTGASGTVGLAADVTMSSSGGPISFASAVNGAQTLTLNSGAGAITLSGAVGGTTPLTNLVFTTTGQISLGGNLTANALNLANSGGFTVTGATNVPTVTLTNTTGTIVFDGVVAITSLSTAASTNFGVTFNNGGTIGGNTVFNNSGLVTLKSGSSSALVFGSGVTNSAGATTIIGAVKSSSGGMTFSPGLTTFGPGNSSLVTSAGTVQLSTTTLSGNTWIDTTNGGGTGGNLSIGQINGANDLTLNTGAGTISLTTIGTLTPIKALSATSSTQISIRNTITTAGGAVTFTGPVRLSPISPSINTTGSGNPAGAPITIIGDVSKTTTQFLTINSGTAGNVLITGNVDAQGLIVTNSGTFNIGGNLSVVTQLSVVNSGGFTVTGTTDAATVSLPSIDSGPIVFTGAVNVTTSFSIGNTPSYPVTFSNGGAIANASIVLFNNTGDLTLNSGSSPSLTFTNGFSHPNGPTFISGTVKATNAASSINLAATTFTGTSTLTTSSGAITLGTTNIVGTTTVDTTNVGASSGEILTFSSTVDGPGALTLRAGSGAITLTGAVGETTPLTSLTLTNTGTLTTGGAIAIGTLIFSSTPSSISIGNSITTQSSTTPLTFPSPVTLTGNSTITTANGPITFNSTITGFSAGNQALTLAAGTSSVTLNQTVGAIPLGALTISSAASGLSIGSAVTSITASSFAVNGIVPTTLSGALTINTSASNGAISFAAGTLNGAQALTLNSGAGSITLGGAVGGTAPLTNLVFTTTGQISIGSNIIMTGANPLTFPSTIVLAGSSIINTNNRPLTFNGAITGSSSGGQTLTLTPGISSVTFNQNVGAIPLGALTISSGASGLTIGPGVTSIAASSFTVQGAVATTLQNTLPLLINTSASNGPISFGGVIKGTTANAQALTLNAGNTQSSSIVTLSGAIGTVPALTPLSTLTVTGYTIVQAGDVHVQGSGGTALSYTDLGSITLNGTTTVAPGGGALVYTGSVILGSNVTLDSSLGGAGAGSNITFASPGTIDGTTACTESLTLITGTTGVIGIGGSIGSTTSINNFSINSSGSYSLAGISGVCGAITLNSAGCVTFAGTYTVGSGGFSATSPCITLTGSITSGSGNISLSAAGIASENILVQGSIQTTNGGGITLTATGGSAIDLSTGAVVRTTLVAALPIVFAGPVNLSAAPTISATNGSIQFTNTINGGFDLALSAPLGTITLGGAVGGTTALTNLTFPSAALVQIGNNISVTGANALTFAMPVSLTGNSAISTTNNGALSAGNNISFSSTLNGTAELTLQAGTGGIVAFTGAVGGTNPLAKLIFLTPSSIQIGNNISVTGGATPLTFPSPVVLTGSSIINSSTGNGGITFFSTVDAFLDSAQNLTLHAGPNGSITLSQAVGGLPAGTTRLGVLTIANANNVTAGAITAASIVQNAGTLTTLNGPVNTNTAAGINLTGSAFTFAPNADIDTRTGAGQLAIVHSGLLTFASTSPYLIGGAFSESGAGTTSLKGTITTSDQNISFGTAVTLSGATTLNSGSGAGDISLGNTIAGGAFNLNLTAGNGNITSIAAMSNLGALSITNSADVHLNQVGALSIATSLITGSTIFNGDLLTTGSAGINLNGAGISFLGNVTASGGTSAISIINSGVFNTTGGKVITAGSTFTQSGSGDLSLAGSLMTSGAITLGVNGGPNGMINLSGPFAMDSGGSSPITVYETIDQNFSLSLTAGTGDIHLNATIGGNTPIAAMTIVSAKDVNLSSVNAQSLIQTAGTGTTALGGAISTTGANGIAIANNSIIRSSTITTTGNGPLTLNIASGGTFTSTAAGAISVGGNISQTGTGTVSLGTDSLISTIGATTGSISFVGPIRLYGNMAFNSGSAGISFGTINNDPSSSVASLTINAGGGPVTFGTIGVANPIGAIAIANASDITTVAVTADSLSALPFMGTATFNGPISTTGATGIILAGPDVTFNGTITTTNGGPVDVENTSLLTVGSATVSGYFKQSGVGGSVSIGGTIISSGYISIEDGLTLTAITIFNTTTGTGYVNFGQSIDGAYDLIVQSSGVSAIQLNGIVGATAPPTTIALQGSNGITMNGAITVSGPFTISGAGGLTTLNGQLNASDNVQFTLASLTLNNTITTTSSGLIGITNSGALIIAPEASPITSAASFNQSGGGSVSLGGDINTSGTLQFVSGITLTNPVSLNSGGGLLTLASVGGAFNLNLASEAGLMSFGTLGSVSAPLATVTIQSANNATAYDIIYANSLRQTAGSGLTSFQGPLVVGSGGIVLTGSQFTFASSVNTAGGGGDVIITHSGLLTFAAGAETLLSGSFTENGTGTVTTAANITTVAEDIFFTNPITLSGPVTLISGDGNIVLSNTVTGAGNNLTLTAGAGFVELDQAVSGVANFAASGASIFQYSSVSTTGTVEETGAISLFGGITTVNSNITLTGNVTTNASLSLTTSSGDISVSGTLNGNTSGLDFTAMTGTGSITFQRPIGASSTFNDFTLLISPGSPGSSITLANFGSASPGASGTTSFTAPTINFNGTTYTSGIQNYSASTAFNFNAGSPATITSSNDPITFTGGNIALSKDLTINSTGENITLTTVIPVTDCARNLTVDAGAGSLITNGTIGTSVNKLLNITLITSTPIPSGTVYSCNPPSITTPGGIISLQGPYSYPGSLPLFGTSAVQVVNSATINISGTGQTLTFPSNLDAATTSALLTINTAGNSVLFSGPVGSAITEKLSLNIDSALDVTAASTFVVGSLSQINGTGTTTYNGGIMAKDAGGISIASPNILLSGTISTASGGPLTLNGTLTATNISAEVSGAFSAGAATISGLVMTAENPIQFTGALTLDGNLQLNSVGTTGSTGSNITTSTIDGPYGLDLTAGTGTIQFTGDVGGGTRLQQFVINSAGSVNTTHAIKASSIFQVAGGTTTLGSLDTTSIDGIKLTGSAFTVNGVLNTTNNGPVVITNNGGNLSLTTTTSTIGGNLTQNGTGPVSALAGTYNVGGAISFAREVTLSNATMLNTSANSRNISFLSTVTGAANPLTLNLGSGNLLLTGNATGLGAFAVPAVGTIQTNSISASSISVTANGDSQYIGNLTSSGSTTLTGTTMTINGDLISGAGIAINNSGLLNLNGGSSSSITGGAFSQTGGGTVQLSGTVTTINQPLSFAGSIELVGATSLSTSSGVGDITFSSSVASSVNGPFNLDLTAGTGTIVFPPTLGATNQIGVLTINSVRGINYLNIRANSVTQVQNSGTTTITGPIWTSAAAGVSLTGGDITQNGEVTTTGAGAFAINHTGMYSMGSSAVITAAGGFTDSNLSTGPSALQGTITTINTPIQFLGSNTSTLSNQLTLNTGSTGANVTIAPIWNGASANLNIIAGMGTITLQAPLTIGDFLITSAATVNANQVTAATITQISGSALTHFQQAISASGSGGINLTGYQFTFDQAVTTTAGSVTINNSNFLTLNPSNWAIFGSFEQTGSGSTNLIGNVKTTVGHISFTGPVYTTGSPLLNASTASQPISFLNTLDGPGGVTLQAGTGAITFDLAIGGLTPFATLAVTSAGDVTAHQTITAASISQTTGSGTTQFIREITTNGSGGMNLVGNNFTFLDNATTAPSSNGPIIINNGGLLSFAIGRTISSDSAFTQYSTAGTGSVSMGANLSTNHAAISFASPIVLTASPTFASNGGNIALSSAVNGTTPGAQGLTLNPGTGGSITAVAAIGGTTRLGAIQLVTGTNISMTSVKANSIVQPTGMGTTGTVTFTGELNTSTNTGIQLEGNQYTISGEIITSGTGPVTIVHTGLLNMSPSPSTLISGPFSESGNGGTATLTGTLTTDNQNITFGSPLSLAGNLSLSTGTTGAGDVTIGNNLEGAHTLSIQAGLGNVTCANAISVTTPLQSLTIGGNNLLLNGVGTSSVALAGPLSLTSLGAINLNNATYHANTQTYVPTTLVNFTYGATTTLISHGNIAFSTGGIKLSEGNHLIVATNNGDFSFINITGGSPEDVTIGTGTGTATLGSLGGGIGTLTVNSGQIYLGGTIDAETANFTSLGTIENVSIPVLINTTGIASFNAYGGDVGTETSPISVTAANHISAGACSTCTAYFLGSSADISNPVHVIEENPPCNIFFNGVQIKDCTPPPPTPAPASISAMVSSRYFAVAGFYDSQFNLASNYFFLTYFLSQDSWKRSVPILVRVAPIKMMSSS